MTNYTIYIGGTLTHSGLTLEQAIETWKLNKYADHRPRPKVRYSAEHRGVAPITVDTTEAPFASVAPQVADLTQEDRGLFLSMVKGQYDNFILQPGIFANAPANFITLLMPADPTKKPEDITSETEVRFNPLYVQLNKHNGHLVQSIAGANLREMESDEDVKLSRRTAPSGAGSPEKQTTVPIPVGKVTDLADFKNNR